MSEKSDRRLQALTGATATYAERFTGAMETAPFEGELPRFALLALHDDDHGMVYLQKDEAGWGQWLEDNGENLSEVRIVDLDTGEVELMQRAWIGSIETPGRKL